MPTYEYVCHGCGHVWEAFQSIKDDPLKDCPSCGEPQAKRQVSAGAGFILKGGGWYSDLYASAKPKSSSDKSSSTSSDSKTSGSGSGDSGSKSSSSSSSTPAKAGSSD